MPYARTPNRAHPSGRPIRTAASRDYSLRADRFIGFRCPRLNPQHIQQATDTHAVGFIDWRIRAAQDEVEDGPYGRKGR